MNEGIWLSSSGASKPDLMWSAIGVIALTVVIFFLMFLPTRYEAAFHDGCSVTIVVLGDIGRSPRMQYHALSIAEHGGTVQFVGYADTDPIKELQSHANVSIVPIPAPPGILQTSNRFLFLLAAPLKVLVQVWFLWRTLSYSTKPSKWILMQNPPSIPTLLVGALVCVFRCQQMIIDWHNFGWSILALKLGNSHPFVAISSIYESLFAQFADAHFAVTDAMSAKLRKQVPAKSPVLTLHDRPAALFQPLTETQRTMFLQRCTKLAKHYDALVSREARLLVSSTSWTADEDFSIFLQALKDYSDIDTTFQHHLPELIVVITGKGPLKDHYIREIDQMYLECDLQRVRIYTDWLSFEDYAQLLGSADLGISLHMSSSGVDLPMKVVDMFGAGLPVLGWSKFAAWPELVNEGVNGRGFTSSEEMTAVMSELFDPGNPQLSRLKDGAVKESMRRWDDEWNPVAGKFFGLVT